METIVENRKMEIDVDKILEEIQGKEYTSTSENSVDVIVLKINNPAFKLTEKNSYDISILGKSMVNWVLDAVNEFSVTEVECEINSPIIDLARKYLKGGKYTIILYSDTPLITKNTINDIITYALSKELKVCKLMRGFVFETEYLKNTDKFYSINTYTFNEQDFLPVLNFIELNKIHQILQQRINNYHLTNGVQLIKPETITIEADVVIGNNVVIEPNVILKGETALSDGVYIGSNSTIFSSIVFENTTINNSVIEKSVIKENCMIEPFCTIQNNSIVHSGLKVSAGTHLNHKEIKEW